MTDEITVRLGLNRGPLEDGLRSASSSVASFASKIDKFFKIGFGAGLAVQGINVVKQGLEALVVYFTTEYVKMWYGDTAAQSAWSSRLAESTKKLRELRKELQDSAVDFSKAFKEGIFGRADNQGKADILNQELVEARRKSQEARDEISNIKSQMPSDNAKKAEFIKAAAEAEIKLNNSLAEEHKLHKKLDEVQETIADKRKKEDERKQKAAEKFAKDQKEWSKKWMDAADKEAEARGNLAGAKSDRSKFTVGELADINIGYNTSGAMAQNIMGARRIKFLEDDARLADRLGNTDYASKQRSLADKMRESNAALSDSERRPFAALAKAMEESNNSLKILAENNTPDGLLVTAGD